MRRSHEAHGIRDAVTKLGFDNAARLYDARTEPIDLGVVDIVPSTRSDDLSSALLDHPLVRKVSFTGSTEVGRVLLEHASRTVVSAAMELGGNAPFVVLPDADLDEAVAGALVAKLRNVGYACTAANRFIVHASLAEEFTRRFAEAMRTCPWGTTVPGGVPRDAQILSQETFGPVAPLVAYDDVDEAVALANYTEYGLVSYVYTRDLRVGLRVAERLDSGMVGLNRPVVSDPAAPFGGTKQSGLGREGGHEGMLEFTESKYVAVEW